MTPADSITRIRRFIRDENTAVFSDAQLFRLYNNLRREFFAETAIRVRGACIPNPPYAKYSIWNRWESGQCGGFAFWEPLGVSDDGYAIMQPWEAESIGGVTPSNSGGHCILNPFETIYVSNINELKWPAPTDCWKILVALWDKSVVAQKSLGFMEQYDASYKTRQSNGVLFIGPVDRYFVSLPRPTVDTIEIGVTDPAGDISGVIAGGQDWFTLLTEPVSASYEASPVDPDQDTDGLVLEIASPDDAFTLLFVSVPPDLSSTSTEETMIPRAFVKYLEYGVIAKALRADTALRDTVKAEFFRLRYDQGVQLIRSALGDLRSRLEMGYESIEGGASTLGRQKWIRMPSMYPRIEG